MGAEDNLFVSKEMLSEELIGEMSALFQTHYEEVARTDIYDKINPDWDFYYMAEKNKLFHIFTARDPDTFSLVGYWWFFVRPNPHYKHIIQAADDMIFVHKDYRGKRVFDYMKTCISEVKKLGAQAMVLHCKVDHSLEKLYVGLGFESYENNYIKRL